MKKANKMFVRLVETFKMLIFGVAMILVKVASNTPIGNKLVYPVAYAVDDKFNNITINV